MDPSDIEDIKNAIKLGIQEGVASAGGGGGTAGGAGGAAAPPAAPDMSAQIGAAQQYLNQLQAMQQTDETRRQIAEQQLRIAQLQLQEGQRRSDLTADELKALQDAVKLRERELATLKASAAEQEKMLETLKAYGKEVGGAFKVFDAHPLFNAQKIFDVGKALFSAKGGALAFVKSLGVGIITSFIDNIIGMVFAMEKARSEFQKATGATREYGNMVMDVYHANAMYTVSMEETTAAFGDLFTGASSFNQMSVETQRQVGQTVAMLQGFNVATSDAAAGFENLVRVMGQTGAQAEESLRELTALAIDFGVAPSQMISDFAQVSPQLAKLGRDGEKAFKNLARVSKITGIEISKLLDITSKFDTFEGAADTAGQLNAALGGNFVNAMDLMMETDPVGRFEMIRGALDDAGLAFDDMDYYQRQFYANALTGGDVRQLALMMSGNMGALGEEVEMTASDYEALAERQASMATLMEKFQGIIEALTPKLLPLLYKFHEFADELISNEDAFKNLQARVEKFFEPIKSLFGIIKMIIDNWQLFLAGWITYKALVIGLTAVVNAKALAERAAASSTNLASSATILQLAAMKRAVPVFVAMGAAVMMMGLGVAAAALGIAELVRAFGGLGSAAGAAATAVGLMMIPFVAFFALMAFVIYSGVGPLTAGVMLSIGAAALMMGGGVALAAYGIAALVTAISGAGAGPLLAFGLALGMIATGVGLLNLSLAALANPLTLT